MTQEALNGKKILLTVSCPPEIYAWLRKTQRNMSAYVVAAIEARREKEEERDEQLSLLEDK